MEAKVRIFHYFPTADQPILKTFPQDIPPFISFSTCFSHKVKKCKKRKFLNPHLGQIKNIIYICETIRKKNA